MYSNEDLSSLFQFFFTGIEIGLPILKPGFPYTTAFAFESDIYTPFEARSHPRWYESWQTCPILRSEVHPDVAISIFLQFTSRLFDR